MHYKLYFSACSLALATLTAGESFYMNIYANEDCNTYKSTQQLGDGFDTSGGCINIDWAESFAVDVSDIYASAICGIRTYENEGCSGLIATHQFPNEDSGCIDSPYVVKSVVFDCGSNVGK